MRRYSKVITGVCVVIIAAFGTYSLLVGRASTPSQACDLYASPTGSDSAAGSSSAPFASLAKLETSLQAGQVGCLQAGNYGSTSLQINLTKSGTAAAPIVIRNMPGDQVVVKGWIVVSGAYVDLQHLTIDGSNTFYSQHSSANGTASCPNPASQAIFIDGVGDTLEYDDIYQSVASLRAVGIGIGFSGQPDNAVVRFNKIHDTGQCDNYDHSIYLAHGNNVQIYGNWIWNNHGGQAISVYPGPTNASIHSNVIDASDSGVAIGDDGSSPVSGNLFFNNVVSNSGTVVNKDDGFSFSGVLINCGLGLASDVGNQVTTSDSYNNPGGISQGCSDASRIMLSGIQSADPLYTNAATHDYGLRSGSPVATYGLWGGSDPDFGAIQGKVGDLNGDNQVNVFDLSIFLSHWQQSGSGLPEDLNGDGNVNVFDLSILLSHYGT